MRRCARTDHGGHAAGQAQLWAQHAAGHDRRTARRMGLMGLEWLNKSKGTSTLPNAQHYFFPGLPNLTSGV